MGTFQNNVLTLEPKTSQATRELPTALRRRQGRSLAALAARPHENGGEGGCTELSLPSSPGSVLAVTTLLIAQINQLLRLLVELDTSFVCSAVGPCFSKQI